MTALGILRRKKKNDIDIPNLFPLKAKMLDALMRKKEEKRTQKNIDQLQRPDKQNDIDLENAGDRDEKFENQLP